MMATLLVVLKIIGIILLVILGIVLLVLCLVLFVPVRYRAEGVVPERRDMESDEDWKKRMYVKAQASWLLRLVSASFLFPAEEMLSARVLCFKLYPGKEKVAKDASDVGKEKASADTVKEEMAPSEPSPEDFNPQEEGQNEEASTEEEVILTEEERKHKKADKAIRKSEKARRKKEKTGKKKRRVKDERSFLERLENAVEKFRYTISGICDKIDMFDRIWNSRAFEEAFALVRKRLIQLFKAILPRKFDAYAHIGTGDPATTAKILSWYGIMYPAHRGNLVIEPDFAESVYDGDFLIKGRIYLFRLLFLAATCYFDKNVRISIKRFQKLFQAQDPVREEKAA